MSDIPMEREVKLALASRADYERVCAALPGFEEEKQQHNTYWDLPTRALTAAGVLLRVRVEGERALVTAKQGVARPTDGVFEAPEDEQAIPVADGRAVNAGEAHPSALDCDVLVRLTEQFGSLAGLERWGHLKNRRRCYRLPDGGLVEVDCTTYPGDEEHWEVEFESDDPAAALAQLSDLLDRAGVAFRRATLTKSERLQQFLDR